MAAPPLAPDIVLVHLSDIHFREEHMDDKHDPDRILRHSLLRDLRLLRADLKRVDAIIVTGDIAFAGKQKEYEFAQAWLETVREEVGCPPEQVLVTPGNHDVNRKTVEASPDIQTIHDDVRRCANCVDADEVFNKAIRHPDKGAALLRPIAAYNDFATNYKCHISQSDPYWERDFTLSDRTVLRLRGITTTFISGPKDDEPGAKLFYGVAQRQFLEMENVRYAVAGHHPPSSTIEGDDAEKELDRGTNLQLFGHKHDQRVTQHDNSVRIVSGALHPVRKDRQWTPRYNAITLRARTLYRAPILEIHVFPRRWSEQEQKFIPDYGSDRKDYLRYRISVSQPDSKIPIKPPT